MKAIEARAAARIHGPEPCPNRILSRRVRDIEDILLVKVERIRPEVIPSVPADYVLADYCLVGPLKGRANRALRCVMHGLTVYSPELNQSFPNPDLLLIKPGAVLLMFSDYSDPVDEPCEVIAATPDALQIIRTNLASPFPDIQEDDRWER